MWGAQGAAGVLMAQVADDVGMSQGSQDVLRLLLYGEAPLAGTRIHL